MRRSSLGSSVCVCVGGWVFFLFSIELERVPGEASAASNHVSSSRGGVSRRMERAPYADSTHADQPAARGELETGPRGRHALPLRRGPNSTHRRMPGIRHATRHYYKLQTNVLATEYTDATSYSTCHLLRSGARFDAPSQIPLQISQASLRHSLVRPCLRSGRSPIT